MRKVIVVWLLAITLLVSIAGISLAADIPRRSATVVSDVSDPYTADDWLISPSEEPAGDQRVSNALECDIKGAIACYDDKRLRVDIFLNNSITYKWDVFYSVRFEYDDGYVEYYTYYPVDKKMVFEAEDHGKITKRQTLDTTKSDDYAGVTSTGEMKDDDVYLIIDKDKHIDGVKGKSYYFTTSFSSGYIDKNDTEHIADETIDVEMLFKK